MKINKIKWAECPYCKILLNGYQFYPAHVLMHVPSDVYVEMDCANCHKKFDVSCKITAMFDSQPIEEECKHNFGHYEMDEYETCSNCGAQGPKAAR